MGADRFADLNAAHGRFGYITSGIPGAQHMPIGEFNRVLIGINLGDDKAAILIKLV